MKSVIHYGSFMTLNESLQLSSDQELSLIDQILESLQNKQDKDNIESTLVSILYSLKDKNILRLKLVDRNDKSNDDYSLYGYFSSYDNLIYLVVDKSNFDTKWFGLKTDYDKLVNSSFELLTKTFLHELIHYTCANYYQGFIRIWNSTFKLFLWNVFNNVVKFYFSDFISNEVFKNTTSNNFIESINFKKAFDTYYNSLLINIRFRYKAFLKRYNDVLSTLYSKQDFEYARFFDNILINTIKLQNRDFNDTSIRLYRCIQKAYIDLEPALANIRMNELYFQELLDFSEIACVFSNYYKYSTKYSKLILDSLELI